MGNQGSRKVSISQCFSHSLCNFSKQVIRAVIGNNVLVFRMVVAVQRGQHQMPSSFKEISTLVYENITIQYTIGTAWRTIVRPDQLFTWKRSGACFSSWLLTVLNFSFGTLSLLHLSIKQLQNTVIPSYDGQLHEPKWLFTWEGAVHLFSCWLFITLLSSVLRYYFISNSLCETCTALQWW
jgi:hypothetical protein